MAFDYSNFDLGEIKHFTLGNYGMYQEKEIEKFNLLEYKNNKAEEELNFMMSNLKYYPDSIFIDKVHLKKHIAKDFISFMLKEMNTSRNRNTF